MRTATFVRIALLSLRAGPGARAAVEIPLLDIQELRLVQIPARLEPEESLHVEVAVIGGGVGGFAAVMALGEAGRRVVWSEETDWLGGQFTSQGLSALDENLNVEAGGGNLSYQEFREGIRDWYRRNRQLSQASQRSPRFSPGNAWVSRFSFEPRAALAVIEDWIHPYQQERTLRVLTRHKVFRVRREGDRILWMDLWDLERGLARRVIADFFLDATEMGDLWPLSRAEHGMGAESVAFSGEPHARPDRPAANCVQSYCYPFVLEYLPGEEHRIPKPPDYEKLRERQPYRLDYDYLDEEGLARHAELGFFESLPGQPGSVWTYRRIIDHRNFGGRHYPGDLSLINWPSIDHRRNLLDLDPPLMLEALREAKNLSLGFLYWLQNEAPDGDGRGHPDLRLAAEALGTQDGLSKFPYIREARRARTVDTLREQDVSAALNPDRVRGREVASPIAVGHYPMDIHPGECQETLPLDQQKTLPFQIPLGVLVPVRMENLVPAGKSAGMTHLTGSCTRLHPIEWALGEAAGALVHRCLLEGVTPQALHADPALVGKLQEDLLARRVPLYWFPGLDPAHPHFLGKQRRALR